MALLGNTETATAGSGISSAPIHQAAFSVTPPCPLPVAYPLLRLVRRRSEHTSNISLGASSLLAFSQFEELRNFGIQDDKDEDEACVRMTLQRRRPQV